MRSAALLLLAIAGAPRIPATTFATLYSFTGQSGDGSSPFGGVIVGSDGSLYGTTGFGGLFGAGTVYRLSSSGGAWTESVIYTFAGGSDGAYPQSNVISGPGGVLYGTTSAGGTSGMGTVFQLAPPPGGIGPWTETVLYSFTGPDGSYPYAAPLAGPGGVLYGATELGGASGYGAIVQLTPPQSSGAWIESVLYSFTGATDGSFPYGGLALDGRGNLLGTTIFGGASQKGVVFKLIPPTQTAPRWTEIVLHSFTGTDGGFPYAGVIIGAGGVLYGTTTGGVTAGSGTAFSLAPPVIGKTWSETILRTFVNGPKGTSPHAALAAGPQGTLLGTTLASGSAPSWSGYGVVFQLTPGSGGAWTETVLHTFQGGSDGGDPDAALAAGPGGVFYGTTLRGGAAGMGTVFSIAP